ncbi:MAG: hypothetical protein IPO91_16405 [Chloroflexi bacterium]|nr:hypothetical protein [Chloroflexota bacterium]
MRRLLLLCIVIGLLVASAASAQEGGGQLWVNAFEDRDGDGARDPNEPFITRGVSVDLLDANGVVVASALLDESPNASRGLIGFQRLSPGTYTVIVTGADWTATTPDTFTQTIEADVMPTVLWYGAQRPVTSIATTTPGDPLAALNALDPQVLRLGVSLLGAVIVMGAFSVLGFLIYLLVYARRAPKPMKTTTTGSMRAVRTDETGEIRSTKG